MVRRNGWTTQWWAYQGGLWWLVTTSGWRVVQYSDYDRDDLRALDWTNLPPECVPAALEATGKNCPPLVDPANIFAPPTPAPEEAPSWPDYPSDGDDAPPATPLGYGMMSGGGGGGGGRVRKRKRRIPAGGPTLTIEAYDTNDDCYGGGAILKSTEITGTVHMGSTDNPKANGIYFATVRHGSNILGSSTIVPGGNFSFSGTVTGLPCSQMTILARAWRSGVADVTASTTVQMQPYCIRPINIHAYYLEEWGYHGCDFAIFNVDINGIALGQIDINNIEDGGTRHSYLSASQAQMEAAFAINPTITINFTCALEWCHEGVAYIEVTDALTGQMLHSGYQDSATLDLHFCPGL